MRLTSISHRSRPCDQNPVFCPLKKNGEITRLFLYIVTALTLSACSLPFAQPTLREFVILPMPQHPTTKQTQSAEQQRSGILIIRAVKASPSLESDRIIYSKDALTRGYYQQTFWNEVPSLTITRLLIERFEAQGVFTYVTKSYENSGSGYSLVAELLNLEHQAANDPGEAFTAIRVELYNQNTTSLVGIRTFSSTIPLEEYTAQGAAVALGKATDQIIMQIVAWVNEAVAPSQNS